MKKKSLKLHAQVAEIAFILLFPSVFYMLYSAGLGLNLPFLNWLLFFHKLFGILALGFGLLFVSNRWRWKGKKYMVLGFFCWFGAFVLGSLIYMLLYGLLLL